MFFFFFKQKTAYEMRISDWSSDVCSSDLLGAPARLIGVELAQLHVHLRGGDAIALQPCGIENDPDFAVDATASHDRCDAFYLEKALDEPVVDIPGQLLQRHIGGGDGEIDYRPALDIHATDDRLQNALGTIGPDLRHLVPQIVARHVHRG